MRYFTYPFYFLMLFMQLMLLRTKHRRKRREISQLITLNCLFTLFLICFDFELYWFIWPPKYISCMCVSSPQMTGKNPGGTGFFPRIEQALRNSPQCSKDGSGLIIALLQQSGYGAWCARDTPVMQWSVIVTYWPLPHLPLASSFAWLNSFVKSTIMEISEEWIFWSLFYCLVLAN